MTRPNLNHSVVAGFANRQTTGIQFLSAYEEDEEEDDTNEYCLPEAPEQAATPTAATTSKMEVSHTSKNRQIPYESKRMKIEHHDTDDDYSGKLPVPSILKNMFSTSLVESSLEDPGSHQGRIRSFPHLRGNWCSFVNIDFSQNEALKIVVKFLKQSINVLKDPPGDVYINSDLHLSLSKTQVFQHHWIDQFTQSFKLKLKSYIPFDIIFDTFRVYLNEEKTRTFVGIEVFASDSLLRLVEDCDKCLYDYDLLPYYKDPSFHVSFAWMVGNHEEWLNNFLIPMISAKWYNLCDDEPAFKKSLVESIFFRSGNRNYELALPKPLLNYS